MPNQPAATGGRHACTDNAQDPRCVINRISINTVKYHFLEITRNGFSQQERTDLAELARNAMLPPDDQRR